MPHPTNIMTTIIGCGVPSPAETPDVSLARCVVCGYEQRRGAGRERVTCPDCGASAWKSYPTDPGKRR
jgi:hypothetical protein